jgi:DNA mismatch repair protein MutS
MLFRVGDFYEAYGADAITISRDLEIVLTAKDCGGGEKIEMAGVPYFSLDNYMRALLKKGHRVAVAEQVEDPKLAKGLVKREVVRVVTSGTVLDPGLLDERRNNFLAAITGGKGHFGLAIADISTGEIKCTQIVRDQTQRLVDEVARWAPAEILSQDGGILPDDLLDSSEGGRLLTLRTVPDYSEAEEILRVSFSSPSAFSLGLSETPEAMRACAFLIRYLCEMMRTDGPSLSAPVLFFPGEFMILDGTTVRNLELTEKILTREREGSLLSVIDRTCTSMGARRLRLCLERPLLEMEEIRRRHDGVEDLVNRYDCCLKLKEALSGIFDLERIMARITFSTANARDLLALASSLSHLPMVRSVGEELTAPTLRSLFDGMPGLEDLCGFLRGAIADNPPLSLREGNIIRDGFNSELDELRTLRTNARDFIARLEEKEREATGIRSLKVGFNSVFGYYIEVTKANISAVPSSYVRKQTLANAERYINEELKEYEAKVLGADERIRNLEYDLFQQVRERVCARRVEIQRAGEAVASLDMLVSFAVTAVENRYVKPEMTHENLFHVKGGRHPVVEHVLKAGFVPNDIILDGAEERLLIITGPNMAGKSTYLRQTALMSIMAQAGSFVPANSARLGLVDRVFTRVGATDDLHLGQSTFMVEMMETAVILSNATPSSLVILDEIGRGTSTLEGLSLAWAVVEYLHNTGKGKTLFATHFHELTSLAKSYAAVRNYRVAVKETKDEVVFLHKILPGGSDRSYGIYVARLAGLPHQVITRAEEIMEDLERERRLGKQRMVREKWIDTPDAVQLTLFEMQSHPILDEIKSLPIMNITPVEAMNKIFEWQRKLQAGE